MLSTARRICAAMSPGCCGAPLASTDVCPEQMTVRFAPLTSLACTKPKASCQLHGLITRRSMAESMGDEKRRRKSGAGDDGAPPHAVGEITHARSTRDGASNSTNDGKSH